MIDIEVTGAGRVDTADRAEPDFGAADLTNCDREPIHIPASVQPHGALLALDPNTLEVVQAGGATMKLLGAAPAMLLGHTVEALIPPDRVVLLRSLLASEGPTLRPQHAFRLDPQQDGRATDAIMHGSSGLIILEFEPLPEETHDDTLGLVRAMLSRVQKAATSSALCQALADEVRRVSGFDRVLVYRFLPDGSGVVDAEARHKDAKAFLGLHYPASDIPRQARDLYRNNRIRVIADTHYVPAPIIPRLNPKDGRPLDLSYSTLRSVSSIHLEYLSNMGVAASMSLSIIIRGQLWGLIACHHGAPRFVPHRLRMAYEFFSEMASTKLETTLAEEQHEAHMRSKRVHNHLVTCMSQEVDLADGLTHRKPNLLDFIPADGVGLWLDGRYTRLGRTPSVEHVAGLIDWLNGTVADGVFHTDRLPKLYPAAADFADVAGGLIALSVSRAPRDYVLWFRQEATHSITWAGNPNKPVESGPTGETLTPRKSFAAWSETVRHQSRPWHESDVEAVRTLRVSLLEVILRRIDQLARAREKARLEQEALAVKLDRRVDEWQTVAALLNEEADRRAILEAELSQVLRSTVEEQEAERRRIARELHDTLGQTLTLLRLGLDRLGKAPAADSPGQLADLKQLVNGTGSMLNRLAWEIRPTALDDLGLQTAISQLTETWTERSNLQFDLHLTLDSRRLDPAVETTVYRVLQEAITNIVRHAEATRVSVLLEAAETEVRMIVEDDGRGFSTDPQPDGGVPKKRLGLLGIRERLSLVSGTLEVESSPGHGCTLFVKVPL